MSLQNKVAVRAMLTALAMVLAWVESQIPYPLPGAKMGLTNLVVLIALYRLSDRDALIINAVRIALTAFTFGNMFSLIYSLAGGITSGLLMIIMKKTKKFSVTAVSISGGIAHNMGQIIVAMIVLETKAIASYLPVLWVAGIVSGLLIGVLGNIMLKRIPASLFHSKD